MFRASTAPIAYGSGMPVPPPDRRPAWPGGAGLWLWAAPAMMTCGNFGLLLALSLPGSPTKVREVDRFLGDVHRELGGGFVGDAAMMAGLTCSAALPGVAFLLRRDGPTLRGWRNAALYAAATWAAATAAAVGMLEAARGFV